MKISWLVFAIITMVCFSLSNLLLKLLVKDSGFSGLDLAFLGKMNTKAILVFIFVIILSLVGFYTLLMAYREGNPALVMAVIGLSAVLIAVIQYIFLGTVLTAKEIIALVLAVISIYLLAM